MNLSDLLYLARLLRMRVCDADEFSQSSCRRRAACGFWFYKSHGRILFRGFFVV